MVDSSKFARFVEKAADRLEQIKQSLLKHEKNPNDREFLNDIFRAVHAIKNAALPMGLGRISELCFHLENYLQNIRHDRGKINQEKIEILIACKDRLGKLIHDIETTDKERATVKDLIKRIQQEMEAVPEAVAPEPVPVPEVPAPEPVPFLEPLTPALEDLPPESAAQEEEDESSLLPDEIKNEEYDRELFQIFIEQMQENISLLRALANSYAKSANKGKAIALCSDLVGKLQTSANYMGYDRLADYYLQWVAELEMAGVELTMGSPVSFDFMDERLKTITGLFPQVKDTPASTLAVEKAESEMVPPQPVVRKQPALPPQSEEIITFQDLFSDMGMGEEVGFGEAAEPIAALSGLEPEGEKRPEKPIKGPAGEARKKRIQAPAVPIDASFLEEERQSPEFDEELFQIFVEQLKENLSELQALVGSYPKAKNKEAVLNHCSTMVGKLQASANYMGYERLAEYYLQWIAQLEMAGVELSMGAPVSFDFMDENIRKIMEVFPQLQEVSAPVPPAPRPAPSEKEPDENASFRELFSDIEEDEEEIFPEDSAPVAALTGYEEEEGWQESGQVVEADLPEVENFFGDMEEKTPVPAPKAKPSPTDAFVVVDLFEGEESAPAAEPVAALSEAEEIARDREQQPAKEVGLSEVDDFFNAFGVELPDLMPPSAQSRTASATPAAPALAMENLFAEAESANAPEPLAALAGAEEIAEVQEAGRVEDATLAEVDDFFGEFTSGEEESFEVGAEPIAALTGEPTPAEAAGRPPAADIESLFLDEEEAEQVPVEKKPEDIEDLFAATAGGDDLDFEIGDESLAALGDSAAADMLLQDKGPAPSRRQTTKPVEDIASLFGEEETEPFTAPGEPALVAEALPPERQEIFRKISHALKSLEEEVPTLEAAVDKSRARAARTAAGAPTAATAQAAEEDRKLFARLLGALEATADDDDRGAAKPIDQVIEEILAAEQVQAAPEKPEPAEMPVQIAAPDVRQKFGLDEERMDRLMDQVGELVASRSSLSQLYQEMSRLRHQLQNTHLLDQQGLTPLQNILLRLEDTTSALSRVSSEIREGVLKVRMVPAGQLFSLYQEMVDNLARKANRQVELTFQGEDTEIDQFTMVDVGDCLLHLISNAISHGIEPAEDRRQSGKNETGNLTLKACHEGNHVVIEVADDGRGIDPRIIKATALAREMLSGDELYKMSDRDLASLIMTPGFTTEAGVTPDSKAPGLDRVKAIMDRLGGTVQVKSKAGKGTLFRLLIPLKLPTFLALKVKAGTEVFALPLSSVEEIVRVTTETLIHSGEAELIPFRAENILLHSLARIAGLETPAPHGERFQVVVVNTDAGPAGLIVDEIIGLDEVPVKPLADYLRGHRDFAGAAIKGDGDFSLIPDVAGLMKTATGAAGI